MERTAQADRARRPGRPKRPAITRDDIAREALVIVDELGWSACTMQLLARRLGVRAPSLYHHVDGRGDLIDLVRGLVVHEIDDPTIVGRPWDEVVRRWGIAYYRAFAAHPNVIAVLSVTPIRDGGTVSMYETFLRALVHDGWEPAKAFEAMIGLEHLALGFAYEWNAEELMLDPEVVAGYDAPLLAEVTRERTDQSAIAESTFLSLLDRNVEMYRRALTAV